MQKVAQELNLQEKLTMLIECKLLSEKDEDADEEMGGDAKSGSTFKESVKEAIVDCFAALTEKLEDARADFVMNDSAILGLVEVLGSDAKLTKLQLAAFDLLRSLGRAKLTKKKILREKFTEKKINFV